MTDRGQRYLLLGLCLFQTCFAILVSVAMYVLSNQIWELREDVHTLRRTITADAGNPLDVGGLEGHGQTKRDVPSKRVVIDGSGLFHDLLVAQENILASHCRNDSKLCMQGPKGDKGDKGDPGSTQNVTASSCECLEKPSVSMVESSTSVNCSSVGNPVPFIAMYEGTRLLTSNKDTSASSVSVKMGWNKGQKIFRCVARNILGDDTIERVVGS